MHKAQQVLRGVTEAHAPPDAAFIIAGGARQVKGDHALILMPEVDHAVQPRVAACDLIAREKRAPVGGERLKGGVKLRLRRKARKQRPRGGLVGHAGRGELLRIGILAKAQHKQIAHARPGRKIGPQVVAAHGGPAAGHAVEAFAPLDGGGMVKSVAGAQKGLPVGIKADDGRIDRIDGIVIAALAVLGDMIDGAALHLDLAGGKVALEVSRVVLRVPEAELHKAEHIDPLLPIGAVFQGQAGDQRVLAARHKRGLLGAQPVFFAQDAGIAQAVAALVTVQRRFDGHPAGGKDAVAVAQVEILAARVGGHAVVAVARQPQQARVAVEAVAAPCVGQEREESLAAQIVDPGGGGIRSCDDIFPGCVVKIAVFHGDPPCFYGCKPYVH